MNRTAQSIAITVLALVAGSAAASVQADTETSYGYLRTVEGPGRVVQAATGASVEIDTNYPVLAGDRLEVDPGGRLELSLPDFNVVRLAGGSELLLARLALSAEAEDAETTLRLLRGEIQFLVHDLLAVAERPRVETANATIYLQSSGVYRIATDGYGWTEVVVREGFAEIATEAGSSVVRGGELAWVEGGRWPRVAIERATGIDELERWGAELDGELAGYGDSEVEDHLAYSAAPLSRHGSWVWEDGVRAWRPSVAASWRPYEAGYWTDTPLGMTWVSDEPWAWVTYHYGSWAPSPSYGWVWRPGRRFAPAWVYWYWGPSYVAWVPVGYYSSHYGHYGRGFRFGIHGWAGGSWGHFADWTFCSTRSYRRRDLRHHIQRGGRLARDTRSFALERGLITTDSRFESRQRAARRGLTGGPRGDSLPDVTAFVARRRDLPDEVSERIFSARRAVARDDLWDEPEAARQSSRRARAAVPRGETRDTADAWRRESGRLRTRLAPSGRTAGPRAEEATPGNRARTPWWENRPNRAGPRGGPARPDGARSAEGRTGNARATGESRPPVVRRVWEGIRDRQRAQPPAGRASDGTPNRRQPSAERRSEPPRRTPSAERRSAPPRKSSTERRSSPPRRESSAKSRSRGSSGRSSAGSKGRSSEGSSRSRSARHRPPS